VLWLYGTALAAQAEHVKTNIYCLNGSLQAYDRCNHSEGQYRPSSRPRDVMPLDPRVAGSNPAEAVDF
jgi:hypothetical protein